MLSDNTTAPTSAQPPKNGEVCNRDGCSLAFPSSKKLKKHQRLVHQPEVKCKIYGTTDSVVLSRNDDQKFACPTNGCNETSIDPVRIQKHVKKCSPASVELPRVMPNPPRDFVHLVQPVDQVIVIPNYHCLVYNSYAKILLCTSCHYGISTNENSPTNLQSFRLTEWEETSSANLWKAF
ncbi:hypothetical protein PGTUg99_003305 [Puccinia graminis f. sp. tritici]|uniref:C2H2-type domain-containing protein n=1 Tax=Puccinia graminis f. sp. tritici TaxID=56615 RepID=A0A5B0NEN0_PUCGR|nr:hypothetical protein PGTUg99_003305 [Puccinia graminis f. sp. tritici]